MRLISIHMTFSPSYTKVVILIVKPKQGLPVLHEKDDALQCHVYGRTQRNEPGDRPSRLWNNEDSVHQSVNDSWNGDRSEQIDGDKCGWVDQDVDETDDKEWQNVFQIVTMGSEKLKEFGI